LFRNALEAARSLIKSFTSAIRSGLRRVKFPFLQVFCC